MVTDETRINSLPFRQVRPFTLGEGHRLGGGGGDDPGERSAAVVGGVAVDGVGGRGQGVRFRLTAAEAEAAALAAVKIRR